MIGQQAEYTMLLQVLASRNHFNSHGNNTGVDGNGLIGGGQQKGLASSQ